MKYPETDTLVARVTDEETTAPEMVRLCELLLNNPRELKKVRWHLALSDRLSQEMDASRRASAFLESLETRFHAEDTRETFLNLLSQNIGKHPARRWRIFAPLATAAGLLLALGLWLNRTNQETQYLHGLIARVESVQGSVFSVQDIASRRRALKTGDEIREGMRIETGADGAVTLAWVAKATTVDVASNSQLETRNSKLTFLHQGSLSAAVAPQMSGQPFAVETPHALATVLGTRFEMVVRGDAGRPPLDARLPAVGSAKAGLPAIPFTRLDVDGGLVRFVRLTDQKSVDVAAGQFAVASDNVELKAYAQETKWIAGRILFEDDFENDGLARWMADILVTVHPKEGESLHRVNYALVESIAADRAPLVSIEKAAGRQPGSSALAIRIPPASDKHINIRPPSPGMNFTAIRAEFDLEIILPASIESHMLVSERSSRSLPVDPDDKKLALDMLRGRWARVRCDYFWTEDDQGEACLEDRRYVNDRLLYRYWHYPVDISFGQMIKSGSMLMDNYVQRELLSAQSFLNQDTPEPEAATVGKHVESPALFDNR